MVLNKFSTSNGSEERISVILQLKIQKNWIPVFTGMTKVGRYG
ncbi:hypothetical protein ACFL40_03965 [candidate division KSB1 bacterium]